MCIALINRLWRHMIIIALDLRLHCQSVRPGAYGNVLNRSYMHCHFSLTMTIYLHLHQSILLENNTSSDGNVACC